MNKRIIYVDMDGVLCDFKGPYDAIRKKYPSIAYPQSHYGFFRKLKPMPGALDSFHFLFKQKQFEVYILTAPSVWNPLSYSEKREWVENHLGMEIVNRLIISPNKGLNKGHYLIDDHAAGRGQEDFEGTLIQFGQSPYENWEAVLAYFKQEYALS